MTRWQHDDAGVLTLPSERIVRDRGLRDVILAGAAAQFGSYLPAEPPRALRWGDPMGSLAGLSTAFDRRDTHDALRQVWHRSASERVEVACASRRWRGRNRSGCLAVLDGVPAAETHKRDDQVSLTVRTA